MLGEIARGSVGTRAKTSAPARKRPARRSALAKSNLASAAASSGSLARVAIACSTSSAANHASAVAILELVGKPLARCLVIDRARWSSEQPQCRLGFTGKDGQSRLRQLFSRREQRITMIRSRAHSMIKTLPSLFELAAFQMRPRRRQLREFRTTLAGVGLAVGEQAAGISGRPS